MSKSYFLEHIFYVLTTLERLTRSRSADPRAELAKSRLKSESPSWQKPTYGKIFLFNKYSNFRNVVEN
jgi:hypothetical protein